MQGGHGIEPTIVEPGLSMWQMLDKDYGRWPS